MGYQIQYSPELNKKYPLKKQKKLHGGTVRLCLAVVVLVSVMFAIVKSGILHSWLLPDDSKIAIAAFVEDVKAGEPFSDAMTSFCLKILENARYES